MEEANLKAHNVELDDRLRGHHGAKVPPARPHHPRIGRGRRRAHRPRLAHANDSAQVAEVTLRNNGGDVRFHRLRRAPIAAIDNVIDKLERRAVPQGAAGERSQAAPPRSRGPDPGGPRDRKDDEGATRRSSR